MFKFNFKLDDSEADDILAEVFQNLATSGQDDVQKKSGTADAAAEEMSREIPLDDLVQWCYPNLLYFVLTNFL